MRLGIFTTVHIRDDAALGNLRVLVDSVLRHVPRGAYERLLVVDDCSPKSPKLDAYYAHLEASGKAEVYRMGEGRAPHWAKKYSPALGTGPLSHGHAVGLMAGFFSLREAGCTHAWIIDGDCVLLRPVDLGAIRDLFQHERVAVVTDYFGGRPDPRIQIADQTSRLLIDGNIEVRQDKSTVACKNAWCQYGFPVLFCAVVDLQNEERFGPLQNAGWVNSRWGARLFAQGFRVAYHPFFQNGDVFHLGLGYTKPNLEIAGQTFGNAQETARYGGKETGHRHAGYLQITRATEAHLFWLREVAARPPEAETVFDPFWLIEPPPVSCGPEEFGLRPLRESDAEALATFDADPDSTRFLSWGPHGIEHTRAFLAAAQRHPWRWFGLQDSQGALLAWGELRPLGAAHGRGTAGLCYMVLPAHRKKGHGERMLNALIEAAYNQMEYDTLQVAIDIEHEASLRVLGRRHDFKTDWRLDRIEPYALRGQKRQRAVYLRGFPVAPLLEDPKEARRAREELLFETFGVWRPA